MTVLDVELKKKALDEALYEAKSIAQRTDLDDEERVDLIARVERIEGMKADLSEARRIEAALRAEVATSEVHSSQYSSLGAAFADSDEYKAWDAQDFRSEMSWSYKADNGNLEGFQFKAEPTVIDETTALPNSVVAQRVNTIQPLGALPLRVASLIPQIGTSSNAVTYYQEATVTHTIAPAAEGAEKGNFTLTGAQVTEELEIIAGMGARGVMAPYAIAA